MSDIHQTAVVDPAARIGTGVAIGPYCVIGADVSLGDGVKLHSHVVVTGRTTVGPNTHVYPFASIGHQPQDLKYKGEESELVIGANNIVREHVTMNPGTAGGGLLTRVGNNCLFMVGSHVAHDCKIGNNVILANNATLAGHVEVEDYAILGGLSAVHQFCRVGQHAFVGGYSVVTKDALPFARTIGSRPARIFGVNTIGLSRRGFTPNTITQLRHAYRYLTQSKLNTTRALAQIEQDESLSAPEVRYLVDFIRASQRGVILRRATRRAEELVADE